MTPDLRLRRALAGSLATGLGLQLTLVVSGILAARILGAEDRGHLALLALIPSLVGQIGGAGIPLAVTQATASSPSSARSLARLVARIFAAQSVALLTVHLVVLALVVSRRDDGLWVAAAATALWIPSHFLLGYALAILQGERRFAEFNLLRLGPPALYAATLVVLFAAGSDSLAVVAAAVTFAPLLVGAIAVAAVVRNLPAAEGKSAWPVRRLLGFGLRSQVGSVSPLESFRLDQIVVAAAFSPALLGIYVVAMAFTNLPRFVAQSVGMIAAPSVAHSPAEGRRLAVGRFLWLGVACSAAVAAMLMLAIPTLLPLLFGREFEAATTVAQILVVAACLMGVRRVLTDALRGAGKAFTGTVAELAALVAFGIAVALLAPRWDLEGVAAAMAVASAVGLAVLLLAYLAPAGRARSDAVASAGA